MSTLKVLREVNGLSQEDVAQHLQMDQSTYSKLEKNPRNLRMDQAEKLATLYNVSMADVIAPAVTISFSNNTIDKGYVHNFYDQKESFETVLTSKDREISALKNQVEFLQKQNSELMEILKKK